MTLQSSPRPRPALSRERVVAAAMDLLLACLDEVAGELGVPPGPAGARDRLLVILH